jgi:DNA-binding NarL/FixJ family response regulator
MPLHDIKYRLFVFCDRTEETLQKLLKIDPAVKAIVSSGYTNTPIVAHYRKYGFSGVVTKPYKASELCHIVNTIIMESRS